MTESENYLIGIIEAQMLLAKVLTHTLTTKEAKQELAKLREKYDAKTHND